MLAASSMVAPNVTSAVVSHAFTKKVSKTVDQFRFCSFCKFLLERKL